MPTSAHPQFKDWLKTLQESVKFEGEVYLVGHSLGCPTILNFLQDNVANGAVEGIVLVSGLAQLVRSEERRVGKECRSRWSPYH